MNERIKQLAVEAGMIVGEPNGFDMTRLMPKEVKFAELIVEECAKRAEVYAYMSPNFNALAEELRSMIGVAKDSRPFRS